MKRRRIGLKNKIIQLTRTEKNIGINFCGIPMPCNQLRCMRDCVLPQYITEPGDNCFTALIKYIMSSNLNQCEASGYECLSCKFYTGKE